jgi:hypothetical protein
MRFVVDLPPELVDGINRLIREGRYRSIQDFLFAAAQNQVYEVEQSSDIVTVPQENIILSRSHSPQALDRATHQTSDVDYRLLTPDLANGKVETVPPPEPSQVAGEMYGLWNRFFPVKITTRVLANMLKGDGARVPLEALQENASRNARALGKLLLKKERDLGRKRHDMIATALPTKRDEFKAKGRFKSHFVGYLSKRGKEVRIEGAPAVLRFINISKGEDGHDQVGLTAAGLRFALLGNPVIDQEDFNSSLSDEERRFLIEHISVELPEERKLMRYLLQSIKGGAANPHALQEEVKKLRPTLNERTELVTFRSGLLSRMSELRLLTRARNGVSVRYHVTSEGERFLEG